MDCLLLVCLQVLNERRLTEPRQRDALCLGVLADGTPQLWIDAEEDAPGLLETTAHTYIP
jgi:hypothetical protein